MVTETKKLNLRNLLGESPDNAVLDDLADRIAARLRRPEKLTLSVNEAAKALGICPNTVYECIHTGQLPAVRFGGSWKISVPALMKMLESPLDRAGYI